MQLIRRFPVSHTKSTGTRYHYMIYRYIFALFSNHSTYQIHAHQFSLRLLFSWVFFFIIKDYILSLVNLKTPGLWIDLNRLERETFRNQNNKPLLFTNWDRDQPKSQQRVQPLGLRGSLQYKVLISFIKTASL